MKDSKNALFNEVQKMTQPWLWGLILLVAVFSWFAFVCQVFLGRQFGHNPSPDVVLGFFVLVFGMGIPVLFYHARLETRVEPAGVYVRFFPLQLKEVLIKAREIESFEARKYNPLLEYGGWGIRLGSGGYAYNARGNKGVQLTLRDGRKIMIGSQHSEELARAIGEITC